MMKIVCKHCGHKIINNNVSGLQKKVRKDLILMDKNKNMGDITIYLIYWRKDKMGSWLDFPGLFYIGQTKKTVEERVYGISSSHFFRAFKNPKCAIEYTIKKYSKNLEAAKKLFKAEPIQIVRYQGTKLLTRKLANMVEKFWIGYFHTQFNEFGRNIEPGGSKVYESIIIPFNFLDNALHEAGFLPRSGNIERKHYVYDKLGLKRTQNRIIDNSIKYWYGFKSKMFVKALRLKRIQIIKDLFERGYKLAYISTELNADRHDIKKWIENDLYKEKKILLPYKVLRNNILIKKNY